MSEGFCLEAPSGNKFTMEVLGYEFPDEDLGPTEDNPAEEFNTARFLVIDCEFSKEGRTWRASSPELTTIQLERLWKWLNSICEGDSTASDGVYFTERNLEFGFDKNEQAICVFASYELADQNEPAVLRFDLDKCQLRTALQSLKRDLERFPGRPPLK